MSEEQYREFAYVLTKGDRIISLQTFPARNEEHAFTRAVNYAGQEVDKGGLDTPDFILVWDVCCNKPLYKLPW